jgi:ABC-type uncharacterized transport system substrate-binding protein
MPTLAAMVDNVLTQNADMLVLTSTPTLQTAVKKVRDIPVIFGVVANPVLAGAGTSDTDHLPNVTGISSASAYDEGAAALLACLPGAKRVGTLVNPSESNCVYNFEQLKAVFAAKGVELVSVPVSTPTEIPDGVRALLSDERRCGAAGGGESVLLLLRSHLEGLSGGEDAPLRV